MGELRDNLRDIAEEALGNPQGEAYGLVLSEVSENLAQIAETMPMRLAQAQAVLMAQRVLEAAQGRHSGDLRELVELLNGDLKGPIGSVNQVGDVDSREPVPVPVPICKSLSTDSSTTTFQSSTKPSRLSVAGQVGQYLEELEEQHQHHRCAPQGHRYVQAHKGNLCGPS